MADWKVRFRAEREFGLIVGGVLVALSAWWLYRGRFPAVSNATLVVGAVLVVVAIAFPRALKYPNKAWMALAEALGYVSSRIILAVIFFGIVTPIGFIKRLRGWDPLSRRGAARDSYWEPYSERQRNLRHYEKMF